MPPIPGIEDIGYLTSDTVWNLRQLPRRLVVLGGGPIGCELTQTFARLGAKVTQVEMAPRILMREDPEVSELVTQRFRDEGIDVLVDHKAKQFVVENGEKILIAEHAGRDVRIPFDGLLVAVGRVANLKGYGLEELGIADRAAPSRPTSFCRPSSPTSMPPATSPGRISSPTPPRTRPGTRRSTRCSIRSRNSAPTTR